MKHGFTLIELLITLVIIGVVIAIGIPGYNKIRMEGEIDTMRTRAIQVQSAKLNFVNSIGRNKAEIEWADQSGDQNKYANILKLYLPNNFPATLETSSGSLIPSPYNIDLGANIDTSVTLSGPSGSISLQKY